MLKLNRRKILLIDWTPFFFFLPKTGFAAAPNYIRTQLCSCAATPAIHRKLSTWLRLSSLIQTHLQMSKLSLQKLQYVIAKAGNG